MPASHELDRLAVTMFREWDANANGLLSHGELKKAMKKEVSFMLLLSNDDFHWKDVWATYDINHDGSVGEEEFVRFYREIAAPCLFAPLDLSLEAPPYADKEMSELSIVDESMAFVEVASDKADVLEEETVSAQPGPAGDVPSMNKATQERTNGQSRNAERVIEPGIKHSTSSTTLVPSGGSNQGLTINFEPIDTASKVEDRLCRVEEKEAQRKQQAAVEAQTTERLLLEDHATAAQRTGAVAIQKAQRRAEAEAQEKAKCDRRRADRLSKKERLTPHVQDDEIYNESERKARQKEVEKRAQAREAARTKAAAKLEASRKADQDALKLRVAEKQERVAARKAELERVARLDAASDRTALQQTRQQMADKLQREEDKAEDRKRKLKQKKAEDQRQAKLEANSLVTLEKNKRKEETGTGRPLSPVARQARAQAGEATSPVQLRFGSRETMPRESRAKRGPDVLKVPTKGDGAARREALDAEMKREMTQALNATFISPRHSTQDHRNADSRGGGLLGSRQWLAPSRPVPSRARDVSLDELKELQTKKAHARKAGGGYLGGF